MRTLAAPSRYARQRNLPLRELWAATMLSAAVLVSAPLFAAATAAAAAQPRASIQIKQAWIRWLPANLPAGGYLILTNGGDRALVLTAVSSSAYGEVALHRSLNQGGISKMVPVAGITIAAHATLSFADAGYHLMLTQPKAAIAPGDHVRGTLHFADGSALPVNFEVRQPAAGAPSADTAMPNMPGMPGMSGMPR